MRTGPPQQRPTAPIARDAAIDSCRVQKCCKYPFAKTKEPYCGYFVFINSGVFGRLGSCRNRLWPVARIRTYPGVFAGGDREDSATSAIARRSAREIAKNYRRKEDCALFTRRALP